MKQKTESKQTEHETKKQHHKRADIQQKIASQQRGHKTENRFITKGMKQKASLQSGHETENSFITERA